MAKDKKLLSKIMLIFFMLMIAAGFTIPVLDFGNEQQVVEPRICQADADCYLICEDNPVKVLCSQNLCQQNACTESSYYPFKESPISFKLRVENTPTVLFTTLDDVFVIYDGVNAQFYSTGMSLGNLFERMVLINQEYEMFVNGEQSYSFANYVPEEGDEIRVVYPDN